MRLVIFEGVECSGKSTLILKVRHELEHRGFSVYGFNKDDSRVDYRLKEILYEDGLNDYEKLLLMYIRYLEKERLIAEKQNFDFVLMDRYDVSMRVYAELLNLRGACELLFDSLSNKSSAYCYVCCHINYREFFSRGGVKRSTPDGNSLDEVLFERKKNLFSKYFSKIAGKKVDYYSNSELKKVMDEICSDMY